MNKGLQSLIITCISAAVFSGCVAQKEFDALANEKTGLENENVKLKEDLAVIEEQVNRLEVQVEELKSKNAAQKGDIDLLSQELESTQGEYNRIKQLYDNLLTNSGELDSDLAQQQQRLLAIEDDLEIERKKNQELAQDLAKREQRVLELEKILADKEAAVQELKRKVTDALLNFDNDELTVEVKNGKVHVSLSEKLLFNSGSVKVDAAGESALQKACHSLSWQSRLKYFSRGSY